MALFDKLIGIRIGRIKLYLFFNWLTSQTPTSYEGGGARIFNSRVFYDVRQIGS